MVSNRVKLNISKAICILGILIIIGRATELIMGEGSWWDFLAAIVIGLIAFIGYRDERKKNVREDS